MKKVIFLFSLFISVSALAQTIFSERHYSVHQKDMNSFLDLNRNLLIDQKRNQRKEGLRTSLI